MSEAPTMAVETSGKAAQAGTGRGSKRPGKGGAAKAKKPTRGRTRAAAPKEARKEGSGTKQEQLLGMLNRKEGTTIDEIAKAFGWLPHTVRGALSGAIKKKLGIELTSERVEGRGRVYRIAG